MLRESSLVTETVCSGLWLVECLCLDLCMAEFERWQNWCSRQRPQQHNSVNDALAVCDATLFPNVRAVLKIFATLPVTTCSAERSFSVLRLIKSYLQSTMDNDRLNGLALLSVHRSKKTELRCSDCGNARKFSTRVRLNE